MLHGLQVIITVARMSNNGLCNTQSPTKAGQHDISTTNVLITAVCERSNVSI